MFTRRALLIASAAAVACGAPVPMEPEPAPTPTWKTRTREALGKAAGWLWGQQSEHGHWRSAMYGPLRSGQSLTPFALEALTRVPTEALPFPSDKAGLALGWLKNVRSKEGAIGLASSAVDYPLYASSLALSAAHRIRPKGVEAFADPIQAWLASQQFLAGWEDHPAHGGFPMGGMVRLEPPAAGHVDLSMTRRAIEALVAAGVPADDPSLQASRGFVLRCQRSSGAFVYSPVEDALNKGVRIDEDGSSDGYGSATTDGLLALLALGTPQDDAAVQAGLTWLRDHHAVDVNPGLGRSHAAFAPSMRFYYRAGAARVFAALGGPDDWDVALSEAIRGEQQPDGQFANEHVLQKEDEPIIATGLAIIALAGCLGVR